MYYEQNPSTIALDHRQQRDNFISSNIRSKIFPYAKRLRIDNDNISLSEISRETGENNANTSHTNDLYCLVLRFALCDSIRRNSWFETSKTSLSQKNCAITDPNSLQEETWGSSLEWHQHSEVIPSPPDYFIPPPPPYPFPDYPFS
ncbi:hypothetical protein NPIL_618871 [Nephila pilipes]|uniref:Uncharacterized protein n=1 Tax=Nephila pilipes TaxID=299642 RepID=A0A8X6TZW2_NEPPI|nr:hypothetical protein NPIL_618871 [Nephila pilipes]